MRRMASGAANYRLFWQEFRRTFHSTGAVLPSSPRLCRALARHTASNGATRRVLEVGPGTGVVTERIIAGMGPADTLDIVELNDRFVAALRERLADEPAWQRVANRVTIHHLPVEQLAADRRFDAMVSGLPLNNFSVAAVETIFAQFQRLAAPGATLSFFEYVAVRKAKSLVCRQAERQRLTGIGDALHAAFRSWRFDRECVLLNMPPAWVHHLRFDA